MNGPDGAVGRLAVPGGRGEPKTLYGLDRLRVGLAQLRGWRRILAGMLLGALAVLALPPLYIVPALIPAFTGLAWLLESDGRSAFATGWWFGLGYFVAGLYWVANALLTKPDEFGWLAAPIGLSLLLVPNIAIACWLARLLAPRPRSASSSPSPRPGRCGMGTELVCRLRGISSAASGPFRTR